MPSTINPRDIKEEFKEVRGLILECGFNNTDLNCFGVQRVARLPDLRVTEYTVRTQIERNSHICTGGAFNLAAEKSRSIEP